MNKIREVNKILKSKPTIEGAGVHLKRVFGHQEVPLLDPFLLLDEFHSENPSDYLPGFPWHPHRGIETVTYMLSGEVAHSDSIGNSGTIGPGDTQWMTAGSGIVHQEMPQQRSGDLWGFQLWVNLPAKNKMMPPRYREVKDGQVPKIKLADDVELRLICGRFGQAKGPVTDLVVETDYIDVRLGPKSNFKYDAARGRKIFAYIYDGAASFGASQPETLGAGSLVVFGDGDEVQVRAGEAGAKLLIVSGAPLGEPVAWRGPIVMNTWEELQSAFEEYENGNFIKKGQNAP